MGVFSINKGTEKFIEQARLKHGNKYDYSKVVYKTTMDKVIITCPKHGEFSQMAMSHTKGFGCKKCGVENRAKGRKLNNKDFLLKASLVHDNFYDYSKTIYSKSESKIIIICPKHGEFTCRAGDHINKSSGCPECKKVKLRLTEEDFISRSNKIHNNRYTYENVIYQNIFTDVDIRCKIHGVFTQTPHSHMKGNGCCECGRTTSNAEIEIKNFLEKNNIQCTKGYGFLNRKDVDLLCEKEKICIEYNGL